MPTYDETIRAMADAALEDIDNVLAKAVSASGSGRRLTTAELADFWHAFTEGATLRLIRLKPEMVRKVNGPPS